MRTSTVLQALLTTLIFAFLCDCSQAQSLIGLWRTDPITVRGSRPGQTNITAESYQTAEFLKDGTFKIADVLKGSNGKDLVIPQGGTYTILDTNHVRLEFISVPTRPDMKIPLTVSFTISADQLEMDAITSSVVPEKTKYRRVKR
ncbi:MAG TPA: hypothetical protein VHC44_16340 [Verrucomicrobiae bacterium]|nr:hypothetical protein [Verrucomicrobiae bacterium]